MRLVIEPSVLHPLGWDCGLENLRTGIGSRVREHMAFFASLLPQEAFRLLDALREISLIANYKIVDEFRLLMGNRLGEAAVEHQGMAARAVFRIVRWPRFHSMAIDALKLYGTIGTLQIALEMDLVT